LYRFLREARAAATLRHSNVASVLHLLEQIGHNHGLFGVGFEGVDQSVTTPGDPNEGDYFEYTAAYRSKRKRVLR
jgi:hypothetical protein